MKSIKQNLFLTILVFLLIGNISATFAVDDIEILRQRFIEDQMVPTVKESLVKDLLATIKSDGTWPGINYQDVSKTGFQHGQHLSNMVEMARAFKTKGSKLKGNKNLKIAINSALDYWLANNFICENWWWNQIGTPGNLISFLLIMDKDITPVQAEKTLAIVGRASLDASGARPSGDRIKIAGILAKSALFSRNKDVFESAVKVIEGEIKFSTERGMQYDYSFHHREDWVNNTLSYGLGYADAFAEWAANVSGTKYAFSEQSLQQLIDYYLDGICKQMIYGKFTDPGVMNRDITRAGEYKAFSSTTPERLIKVIDYRKNELEEIVKIRKGETVPKLAFSKFFWNSDHFAFQRSNFYTSVRMYSVRNSNMEQPYNGEGLMNHHRGDGTNYISLTGNEYNDITPVYDWQKIPGTTVVQKPSLPSENEIQKKGLTDFVGATTDGRKGAVAFDFKSPHDPLKAKKAWFFFEKEYVCLGAGINSTSEFPVATTLNQCWLHGDVMVMSGNEKQKMESGEHLLENVKCIYHDGVCYYFREPAKVNLSNKTATGSWYNINKQSRTSKEDVSGEVFKLWIDHGKMPVDATYQYIVIPATAENDTQVSEEVKNIEVLSNTPDIQAVRHSNLNMYEFVFYKAGSIDVAGDLKVGIESSGIVLVKTDGHDIKQISVSDPTHKLTKIQLMVNRKISGQGENYSATWNNEKKVTEIVINLPADAYAGKSVTIGF